jgi:hypothetical protein
MVTAVALSIAGLVFVLVELDGEFEKGAHPAVGLAALVLAFVQPIMAQFRCAPDHPRRAIFNWAHFFVGNSAYGLAGACGGENHGQLDLRKEL